MTATAPSPAGPTPASAPSQDDEPHVGRLIALLVGAAFVVILNETIMSVALPHLMVEFDVAATTAQWMTTAFMLTMAVVIPVTGYLMTRLSLRTVFLAAMSSFLVGTVVAALAPVFPVLVAGRVVQAVGTALMMPLLFTTVLNVVAPERRGRTMGVISIVIAVAPAVGPTVGGVVLDQLSWRWMFWLVLPIAVLATVFGGLWIRNVTEPRDVPLDVLSVVLSALGFAGLVFGLSSIGEAAEGEPLLPIWIPLTVGLLSLAVFAVRQTRLGDRALLDLRAFLTPAFTLATVLVAVSMMALFGTLILLPIYLQNVLGRTPLEAGLMLLPGGLTLGALGLVVGGLFDRYGPRPLVPPGAVVASAALWGMTTLDAASSVPAVIGWHVLLNVGLSFMFSPLLTAALGSLPQVLYSHGSAIVSTLQQVAGAAGTALFITVMTRTAAAGVEAGGTGVAPLQDGIHAALLWGASISLVAVVGTLLVRRPEPVPAPPVPERDALVDAGV
ncbi:MDR family MFS transporter [Nocardioides solisilvae]|uniref:MDR family MFS transporter n=1 Tax=Nocardioides solisilvae TaxID=1542435 RepID=UPI000D74ECAD|nr:MDR family MFS transporter [Nocardioides solisilvae]